jgi:hypothetical protein
VDVKVALGQFRFETATLDRALYATGWDGSVVVSALRDGTFKVATER